jgi:hypothetical protein
VSEISTLSKLWTDLGGGLCVGAKRSGGEERGCVGGIILVAGEAEMQTNFWNKD